MIHFFPPLVSKIAGMMAISLFVGTACSSDADDNQQNLPSQEPPIEVETLVSGLDHPWGMAFLPDGRLLITERSGALKIMDSNHNLSQAVQGVPKVFNRGQGGLLDVALHPDFTSSGYVYLSFSEPGPNNTASTAVGRGVLENDQLNDFTVIFRQEPKVEGQNHFGGRIVFTDDGYLFLTMGERFAFDPAQDLTNHLGTIVRLSDDGSVPQDNPFVEQQNAAAEIWSYGHRNIEAAAIDPGTGRLWIAEMGPRGGDELNLPLAGTNYGWPIVSWGEHYNGEDIPDPPSRAEFADATIHWTPVISPSGMEFYTGELFPEFKGNMLIGGLTAQGIVRVRVNGDQAEEIGRIELGARTRDVEQAPDGSIYVLTDKSNGAILRLFPGDSEPR